MQRRSARRAWLQFVGRCGDCGLGGAGPHLADGKQGAGSGERGAESGEHGSSALWVGEKATAAELILQQSGEKAGPG